MAADAVDDDTLQLVLSLWQRDQRGLPGLFRQLPAAGRLKQAQTNQGTPYAQIACEKGRDATRMTSGARIDYRKVTLTCWGTKAEVTAALKLILALFNDRTGSAAWQQQWGDFPTFPSGARFLGWWPLNDGELKEDPATKSGTDIWQGLVLGEVRSVRVSLS